MNQTKSLLIILFLCVSSLQMKAQFITIDDQRTPQQLIENVLVNSSCAAASNSTGSGDTFRPGRQSFAYFNSNGSGFPFSEGIVLVTSTAQSAVGPFEQQLISTDNTNWLGDSDLDQTLGIRSVNSTVLEFDFVASASLLSFNYIFASNEYQYDYPCHYSDGFAFLIKEAGTTNAYKNLAVLPNTALPVSSINIHPRIAPGTRPGGITYTGCEADNEHYFNGINGNTSPVNFAGQTVVMNAQTDVIPGKTYHVKLVIADDQNKNLESAVFLEAGSFTSKVTLGEDRTIAGNNPACFGEKVLLDTKLNSTNYTFKWYKTDNPSVTLGTNSTYEVTNAGVYKVDATVTGTTCITSGEIKIDYAPEIFSADTSLVQCDDDTDGISIFNLGKVNNIVKNNNTFISNEGFYETVTDAENKTNPIADPEHYRNKAPDQIVYARLENEFDCFKIAEVTLKISNTPIADPNPIQICDMDENQDGLSQFDLNAQVTPVIITGLPAGLTVIYYANSTDAVTETNPLPNIYSNTTPFNQTIYARVINGPSCYDIVPVNLVVNTFNPPNFDEEVLYLCKGSSKTLSVDPGFSSYLWNTGETANSIIVTSAGDYTVTVQNAAGCEKTKKFVIILSEPAVITNAVIKDFSGNDNSVLIEYTGTGNYEFSLDGVVFQDEPLFTRVPAGAYNTVVRNKNGCGLSNIFTIYVLDYPKFFTPNGDGFNDLWTIEKTSTMPNYTIHIFDRYGKLLKQLNQNSSGWNGIFNGQPLPSDDYWFTLLFADGKSVKGHFSLKR